MTDTTRHYTLGRGARIKSRKAVAALFAGGCSTSVTCRPLRAVYMQRPHADGREAVDMLVSVSKRKFKHAVDRNRIKRLVREAFRLNRHTLSDRIDGRRWGVSVAFVWLSPYLPDYAAVESRVREALAKIGDTLCSDD